LDGGEGARASVLLSLRPGATLDKRRVSGIVHLVSGAVKGLKAEDVSILDAQGRLLAGGRSADGVYGRGNELLDLQRDAERGLEEKAATLLDGLLGVGRSIVRVRVEMDDRVVKEQTESFDPTTPLRSEQQTPAGGGAAATFVKNYEVGRTVKEITATPGAIKKMFVSVAVNGTFKDDANAPGAKTYVPRTDEELQTIAGLVKQTVGFSEDREDQFEIKTLAFDTSLQETERRERESSDAAARAEIQRQRLLVTAQKIVTAIAIVLVIFIVYRFLMAGTAPDAPAVPLVATGGGESNSAPAALPAPAPIATPEPGRALDVSTPEPAVSAADAAASLVQAARKNPAVLARMMHRQFNTRAG
jgi:flagellar M-ring protein FliF